MLLLRKEDGTLPETEGEALDLTEAEIAEFSRKLEQDPKLSNGMASPLSRYEQWLLRTYLMVKLNGQIPNGSPG
jgi:hypothetical protein